MKSITFSFLPVFFLCFLHNAFAYLPTYILSKYNRKSMNFEVSNSKLIIPGGGGANDDDSPSDEQAEDVFGK